MKVVACLPAIISLLVMSSCVSETNEIKQDELGEVQTVKVVGPAPIVFDEITGKVSTKGTSVQDGSALLFNWALGDTLGIFPNQGNQVEFPITGAQGSTSASFDGGGWALRNNASYAAYYPFSVWNYHRDNETILLDYSGQVQNGNGSFAHLSAYDYLASNKTTPQNSSVTFQMERQGSILYIDIVVPEPETITALTILCNEPIFVEKAALDISGDTPVVTPIKSTESLTLSFENTETTTDNETVRAYMAVQPLDFSGKTVIATLYTATGSYTASVTPRVVNKGRAAFLRFSESFSPVNIEFADAEVKRICVENWDTNGDGELSYKEAAAVTDLGNAFSGNQDIVSFNELEYFTGLTSISERAFASCSYLKFIIIPREVTRIEPLAFFFCSSLTAVTLPHAIETIENQAFSMSGISTFHIPQNVRFIGAWAIDDCNNITVAEDNQYYCAKDGVLFDKGMMTLVCYPNKKSGSCYSVPDGITIIGSHAFYNTELVNVSFPETLQTIESYAFRYARNITELNLPSSLRSIEYGAFECCDGLTSITIPASVESMPYGAGEDFYGAICNGSHLQNIIVDAANTRFKTVDGVLFDYSGTVLLNYPAGREGNYIVPQEVDRIAFSAFARSKLSGVNLREGISEIDFYAFCGLVNMRTIVFPSTLIKSTNSYLFSSQIAESVTFLSTIPLSTGCPRIHPDDIPIYVPNESLETYKTAQGWSAYAERIFGIDVNGSVVGPDPQNPD
jgi:hypothetical protein